MGSTGIRPIAPNGSRQRSFTTRPSLCQKDRRRISGSARLVGLEGLAGWLPSLLDRWEDPDVREAILFAARATGTEASVLGLSAHLLLVAERGSDR